MKVKVTYKHWKTGELLECTGTLEKPLNNDSSDRIVVKIAPGVYEDIIKKTIIKKEILV